VMIMIIGIQHMLQNLQTNYH